ncbi:MAG: cation-translocating P-type ATPase C-terminal domain-containing protein, partial [Azonexus sp.]|nr:cation-translocating P-type ATPase C-terminal domain-containing protein [Azonexus sp.]
RLSEANNRYIKTRGPMGPNFVYHSTPNSAAILCRQISTDLRSRQQAPFTAIHLLWINIIMDGPPAMTLGIEPARPEVMSDKPRSQRAQILDMGRLLRLALYGLTMMVGTLFMFQHGLASQGQPYALTLAFTTFVLFQFFNVFNARSENGTVFNKNFFSNGKLWLALAFVLGMQVLAVQWGPAQTIFDTVDLKSGDWWLAIVVASSVLILDEGRKLLAKLIRGNRMTSGIADKSAP